MISYKMKSKDIYIKYGNYEKVNYTVYLKNDQSKYDLYKKKEKKMEIQTIEKNLSQSNDINELFFEIKNTSEENELENKLTIGITGKYNTRFNRKNRFVFLKILVLVCCIDS